MTFYNTQQLKASGKLITDIFEGYTRYAMADDGRVFRCGYIGRRKTPVWIDDENGVYYNDLYGAYFEINAKAVR